MKVKIITISKYKHTYIYEENRMYEHLPDYTVSWVKNNPSVLGKSGNNNDFFLWMMQLWEYVNCGSIH